MKDEALQTIKTVVSKETYKDIQADMAKQPFGINLSQWLRWVIDNHLYKKD